MLVDTNVFLELLLSQVRAAEARQFLETAERHEFFVSDYALHSIGLLLLRCKQPETFRQFLSDLTAGVRMVCLLASELGVVIDTATRFNLDFDDAYQYAVADKYGLTIVSFDADFDRTARGRKAPAEVL